MRESNPRTGLCRPLPQPLGQPAGGSHATRTRRGAGSAGRAAAASGRRDSNPRPSPWQGDALPTALRPRAPRFTTGRRMQTLAHSPRDRQTGSGASPDRSPGVAGGSARARSGSRRTVPVRARPASDGLLSAALRPMGRRAVWSSDRRRKTRQTRCAGVVGEPETHEHPRLLDRAGPRGSWLGRPGLRLHQAGQRHVRGRTRPREGPEACLAGRASRVPCAGGGHGRNRVVRPDEASRGRSAGVDLGPPGRVNQLGLTGRVITVTVAARRPGPIPTDGRLTAITFAGRGEAVGPSLALVRLRRPCGGRRRRAAGPAGTETPTRPDVRPSDDVRDDHGGGLLGAARPGRGPRRAFGRGPAPERRPIEP